MVVSADILLKLWAKKKKDSDVHYPLFYHMVDVATVTKELWERSLHAGAKNFISREISLPDTEARKWVSFWAGLHDIGKASPGFQAQSEPAKKELQQLGFTFFGEDDNHGAVTACLLRQYLKESLGNNLAHRIATTVGGHHGIFPRSEEVNRVQPGVGFWPKAQKQVFDVFSQLCGVNALPPPATNPAPAFFMFLAGITSVADWIASNSNKEYFPLEVTHRVEDHLSYAQKQSCQALEKLGWIGWQPPSAQADFQVLFNFNDIRPLQGEAIVLAPILKDQPGLVIIEAPMGEGKTEAAMYLADNWTANLEQKGYYFALPTMATSDQMFGRVKSYLENRYHDERINLMLLHGHASLSAEFQTLQEHFEPDGVFGDNGYDGAAAGVVASEWFTHRKRGLLAPFGVGTVDQILLAVLQTRHVFVRLFGLANKTVIIDEVHAYDAYMTTLLERLLEWLAALGTSVVILSATLPRSRRDALLTAYSKGLIECEKDITSEVSEVKYPRISWTEGEQFKARHIGTSPQSSKTLHLEWIKGILFEEGGQFKLSKLLQESLSDGGCAAVICNTVDQAQRVYLSLKPYFPNRADDGHPELDLLHARYPYGERRQREERTLLRFGKPEGKVKCEDGIERIVKRPRRAVLVSTQIIEQSLDLDFDLMVSEMAPVDLLLQRAGRLHRHKRERLQKLKEPTLWICQPQVKEGVPDFGGGTQAVYDYHVLLRSWLALQNSKNKDAIKIPDDVEGLIEEVYNENKKCPEGETEAIRKKWEESQKKHDADIEHERSEAEDRWIKRPRFSGQLWRMTYEPREEDDPSLHQAHQALTRLTGLSVNVVCIYGTETQIFLDKSLTQPVDFSTCPSIETVNRLLRCSTSISRRGLAKRMIEDGSLIPPSWRKATLLRHHYIFLFDEQGDCQFSNYHLHLDDELGLVIERG